MYEGAFLIMGACALVYHAFGSGQRDSADDCHCWVMSGLGLLSSCDTQRLRLLVFLRVQCSGLCLQDIVCLRLTFVALGQRLQGKHGSSTPTDRCSVHS
jgi:hypothetical protein